jgi:hypothetical protein
VKFIVDVIESERGWGQRLDETRTFDTYEEAARFRDSINSQNTAPEVPDIYLRAAIRQ